MCQVLEICKSANEAGLRIIPLIPTLGSLSLSLPSRHTPNKQTPLSACVGCALRCVFHWCAARLEFLLKHRPDLDPYAVLQMATISGADALLGAGSEFGTITAGSGGIDSLVAVRTAGQALDQVWRDFAGGELLCTGSL